MIQKTKEENKHVQLNKNSLTCSANQNKDQKIHNIKINGKFKEFVISQTQKEK